MRSLTEIQITLRDLEVLQLLAEGLSNREIAARLGISERTVKQHLYWLFRRLVVTGGKVNRILLAVEYARAVREMPLLAS